MEYRTLGRWGAVVSTYSLGTMTFGSSTAPDEAGKMIAQFLSVGGTVIETADVYNAGEAETIVGDELRRLGETERSRVFLASKGRFPVGVEPRDSGLSRRHLSRALDASLRRLGMEHIDLYQLHSWDPLTPIEESLGFLEDAVRSGKISYGGLSNFTGWQIAKAASWAAGRFPLVSMQPQYNLLVREVEWEILPACADAGLAVLPWSPLGGGWLTGKYSRNSAPAGMSRLGENPEGDGVEAYARRSGLERTWQVIEAVKSVADAHGVSPAQVALAWLHQQPAVTSVILGARSSDQLQANLGAVDLLLDAAELAQLSEVSDPDAADYPYGRAGLEQRSRNIG
jgi:aryl-alcohol dehydrogenase-like predicted oxidoreductase